MNRHRDSDPSEKASRPPRANGEGCRCCENRPQESKCHGLMPAGHTAPLVIAVEIVADQAIAEKSSVQAVGASGIEIGGQQQEWRGRKQRHENAEHPEAHRSRSDGDQ